MSFTVVVIGSNGQVGFDILHNECEDFKMIGLTHNDVDISDELQIKNKLDEFDFDILINTAAYHGPVAYADMHPQRHFEVNAYGPFYLAKYCNENNKKLVHISTDYIFCGNVENNKYFFTENDNPIPVNLYGISKLAGENLIRSVYDNFLILRVAGVFGHRGSKVKEYGNFVELVLNKYKNNENVKVVSDIFSTFSSTDLIVYVVNHLIINNIRGVYHVVGSDTCSWYEFASEIFNLNGFDKNRLSSIQSADKKQLINRGNNTSLSNKKLLKTGIQIPNWKILLENYFKYEKI